MFLSLLTRISIQVARTYGSPLCIGDKKKNCVSLHVCVCISAKLCVKETTWQRSKVKAALQLSQDGELLHAFEYKGKVVCMRVCACVCVSVWGGVYRRWLTVMCVHEPNLPPSAVRLEDVRGSRSCGPSLLLSSLAMLCCQPTYARLQCVCACVRFKGLGGWGHEHMGQPPSFSCRCLHSSRCSSAADVPAPSAPLRRPLSSLRAVCVLVRCSALSREPKPEAFAFDCGRYFVSVFT